MEAVKQLKAEGESQKDACSRDFRRLLLDMRHVRSQELSTINRLLAKHFPEDLRKKAEKA